MKKRVFRHKPREIESPGVFFCPGTPPQAQVLRIGDRTDSYRWRQHAMECRKGPDNLGRRVSPEKFLAASPARPVRDS